MSKLEELIEQYCPDGVEWKPLGEATIMKRGTSATKGIMQEGDIPVISGGRQPAFYCNVSNRTGEVITVAGSGAGAGYVQYWNEPIFVCDAFSIQGNETLKTKYVYYILTNIQEKIYSTKKGGGVPHVHISSIDKFEIPVPPLPVQEEIVRILDAFTELQAELQKRLQQYNYYLDNLLIFNSEGQTEVKWMKIGDICDVFTGGEVPMGSIKGNTSFGSFIYPIWGNGKDIYGYATTYQIDKDAVCISSIGANSGAVFFHKAYFTPIIRLKVLIPRNQSISVRYLFYILSFVGFDVKKSSVPNMNSNEVKQKVIPVPPLAEQQRIVSILDRFDTLTTDLTQGLPAEIEKRRQQYEYYRDKLLTFKRKEA